MPLSYRDDRDVDLAQLGALFRSVGWESRGGDTAKLARIVSGSLWVVTAWQSERLVGFARAISDGVTTAYVTDVMVDPSMRRAGIATELVRRLVADKDDIQFVLRAPPHLHPFYRSLGFGDPTDMLLRRRGAEPG